MTYVSEAEFTPANDVCPHPEFWHALDVQSAEVEVCLLVAGLVRGLQPDLVVETGTAHGLMASHIGAALLANGHGWLETTEIEDDLVAEARERCDGLPVTVIHGSSLDYQPSLPIDFAWFDSLVGLRVPEFMRYRSAMHAGTLVGFHDTGPQHSLRPHLETLAATGQIQPIFLPTPRGLCLATLL